MSRFNIYLSVVALLFASSVSVFGASSPASRNPNYEAYIAKWSATAQAQQAEYGIPASITLAQGLLESAAGQSELATKANNHFGIKCHNDWQGRTFYKKAEKGKECFRSYDRAEDSFRDHSLFLKRKRYEVLFTYKVTDYKAWARGLRECGYATDPKYPQKLINLIETYELDQYAKTANSPKAGKHQKPDKPVAPAPQVAPHPAKQEKAAQQTQTKKRAKVNNQTKSNKPRKHPSGKKNREDKAAKRSQTQQDDQASVAPAVAPVVAASSKPAKEKTEKPKKEKTEKPKKEKTTKEPTSKPTKEPASKPAKEPASTPAKEPASKPVAEPAPTPAVAPVVAPAVVVVPAVVADSADWSENELRTNTPYAEHASGTTNGRRYIVAQQGDTWGSLAYTEGMEESTLRHINDANDTQALQGGDKVYFMPKRSKADKQHPSHTVKAGETAWSIAQEYGMKVATLYKLNGLTEDTPLTEGQYLYLR